MYKKHYVTGIMSFKCSFSRIYSPNPDSIQCITINSKREFVDAAAEIAVARQSGLIEFYRVSVNDSPTYLYSCIDPDCKSIESMVYFKSDLYTAGCDGVLSQFRPTLQLQPKKRTTICPVPVWALASCKKYLLAAADNGDMYLVNFLETMCKSDPLTPSHCTLFARTPARILCVAFEPHCKALAAGTIDALLLYDIASRRQTHRIPLQRQQSDVETLVWSVSYTPDGAELLCGDSTGTTSFWNVATATLNSSHKTHCADVLSLACRASATKIVVCSTGVESSLKRFERPMKKMENVEEKLQWTAEGEKMSLGDHDLRAVVILPDLKTFVCGGVDGYLRCGSTSSIRGRKPWRVFPYRPQSISIGKDTALCSYKHSVDLWNVSKEKIKRLAEVKSKSSESLILCSAVDPSGTYFAYSTAQATYVYEVEVKTLKRMWPRKDGKTLRSSSALCFTNDGFLMLARTDEPTMVRLDLSTNKKGVVSPFCNEEDPPSRIVQISSDKADPSLLCVKCSDGSFWILRDLAVGTEIPTLSDIAVVDFTFLHWQTKIFVAVLQSNETVRLFDVDDEVFVSSIEQKFTDALQRYETSLIQTVSKSGGNQFNKNYKLHGIASLGADDGLIVYSSAQLFKLNLVSSGVTDSPSKKKRRKSGEEPVDTVVQVYDSVQDVCFLDSFSNQLVVINFAQDHYLSRLPTPLDLKKFGVS